MSTFRAAVRHCDGSTNVYEIGQVQDWYEAAAAIKLQVLTAKVVLVLIPCGVATK